MTHSRQAPTDSAYLGRLAAEVRNYAGQETVHDLPAIFHHWSNAYLRPLCERLGFSNPDELFVQALESAHRESSSDPVRFVSIGAGNCDAELRIAKQLVDRGLNRFQFDCLDINESMLDRGREVARSSGLEDLVRPMRADFNEWRPAHSYDAVMANQSLHHVFALEALFSAVEATLPAHGRFVVSDIIGRNGHRRWPEALAVVQQFWRELPSSFRFNLQLQRHEETFMDWDCSDESFEGVRAQDVVPLLVERFDFELFLGFGNVIDPFIDRSFGPHFDPAREWDRDFIARVHQRDTYEIDVGSITPTHMFAVLRRRPFSGEMKCLGARTPESAVRVV